MSDATSVVRSCKEPAEGSAATTLLELLDGPGTALIGCTHDGTIGYWSAGAAELFGQDAGQAVGRRLRDVFGGTPLPAAGGRLAVRINGRELQAEARQVALSQYGFPYPLLLVVRGAGDGRREVSGRARVLDQVQDALARHLQQDSYGALLVLDLDSFASLRSELGCAGSQDLLDAVGARLRNEVRAGDSAERLDGDQFAVVCSALADCPQQAARRAEQIARSLLDSLAAPFVPGSGRGAIKANVGVTVFGARGASPESVLRDALFSLRAAKITGPDAVHVFNERMRQLHNRQAALRTDLRQALARRELQVHYQVQVNLDGVPIGVEALARWRHPEQGWVPPDLFIPVAEAGGMICELGQQVLEQVCEDLYRWRGGAAARLSVSVNVSPLQLRQPDFVGTVLRTVREYGIDPRRLKLEVTETALIDEMDATVEKLAALRSAGMRVSLDDFGKGYSALAYLKRLPLDQVKIDQAFMRDIAGSAVDQEIAAAIVTLAYGLHLDAIAEGIETREQYLALRDLGCRSFQGYLFGKPQPAHELEASLGNRPGTEPAHAAVKAGRDGCTAG